MKNLNDLVIKNSEANLEHGFFFVEFSNGRSLQCCLVSKNNNCDEDYYHVEQIEAGNSGHDEGLSYDCNKWAADEDGSIEHVELFLIEQARKIGIEIVAQ